MIKKNVPMINVKVIAFWYQTQPMCIKWGKANSEYFNVSNGVHLGRFAIYIDDLSNELALCKSGCYINEQCMDHVIHG